MATTEEWVNLIRSRGVKARDHYQPFFKRLSRFYDLYRGIVAGNFQQFRNNVHIPFMVSVIQSDVARKVQTSFGSWPIVSFGSYPSEGAAHARNNETLISAQMKDARSFIKAVDFYTGADLYGTAIARVGWRECVRKEMQRGYDDVMQREYAKPKDITWFDGPNWDAIDPVNFWGQIGRKRIGDLDDAGSMEWCIHRYWVEFDTLVEQAHQGKWDLGAVMRLKESNRPETPDVTGLPKFGPYRSFSEYAAMMDEPLAKPVEIWDYWGLCPSSVAGEVRFRNVVLANQKEIIKNVPTPLWHGRLPFIAYSPMPDLHYFHGTGKMEIAEKLQITANRLMNHQLDALDLAIAPPIFMDRNSGIDTNQLQMSPGAIFGVDGAVDESKIRAMPFDLGGINQAAQGIAELWGMIQNGTGLNETVTGNPGDRQTAREFLGKQEASLTRLMLEAKLAEEGFIEPMADMMRALNKQYLKLPKKLAILGQAAQINQVTGLPMPQEETNITLEDVNGDYKARAIGATQMLGKAVKQQNLVAVLQILSSNPAAVQIINWAAFFRQTFETFDLKNVDELLVQQVPAVNQVASQNEGQVPDMSQMMQGMGSLNPDMIGSMLGSQNQSPIPMMQGV